MTFVDEVRAIPGRYWALALALAVVLVAIPDPMAQLDYGLRNPRLDQLELSLEASTPLTDLMLFASPLVALRWVWVAAGMAVVPGTLMMLADATLEAPELLVLVAVAMAATWRAGWRALLVLAPAAVYVAVLVSGRVDLVAPDGAVNDFNHNNSDPRYVAITFLLFLVPMLLAVAASMWLRSSAKAAAQEAELAARSAAVDADAAVVGERARLARDLHDVVAHHVSLIAVRAETAPYSEPGMTDSAKGVLRDIADDARAALDELRGVLGILNRSDEAGAEREPLPGITDVEALVERARRAGDDVSLTMESVEVGASTGYVAYRVVQEALTNARKHAPGQPVTVVVSGLAGVRVEISNPLGENPVGPERGLAGMRERVESVGGRFLAGAHGDRFVVDVLLPARGPA